MSDPLAIDAITAVFEENRRKSAEAQAESVETKIEEVADKPAEDKPAAEAPAEDKPAEEKPAEDAPAAE